jgi:hypothetical protein
MWNDVNLAVLLGDRSAEGMRERFDEWNARFQLTGETLELTAMHDAFGCAGWELVVRPAVGYVADEEYMQENEAIAAHGYMASGVLSAVMVLPLWRAGTLEIVTTGPDGRPADGARVAGVAVAGRLLRAVKVERAAADRLRLGGVPCMLGERVDVAIDWYTRSSTPNVMVVEDGIANPEVEAVIPWDCLGSWRIHAEVGESDHIRVFNQRARPRCAEPGSGAIGAPAGPTGSVVFRVVDRDGAPLPDALVMGRRADANGEVRIDGVSVGEHAFTFHAPGRLGGTARASVREGTQTVVDLVEPNGGELDVVVTNETGQPCPFAVLDVRGASVFDVQPDGAQRLDNYTDVRGFRAFSRVSPGAVVVTATWRARAASGSATVENGKRTRLLLVVR